MSTGVLLGDGRQEDVDDVAVLLHESIRDVPADPRPEVLREHDLDRVLAGLRGEELDRFPAEDLRSIVAQRLEPAIADAQEVPVPVDGVHHHRGTPVERTVLAFARQKPSACMRC
jgi:hypothetical protein